MPTYLEELTRENLSDALDWDAREHDYPLTKKVWDDFIEWSSLDPAHQAELTGLSDWIDEYFEFESAYANWKESKLAQPTLESLEAELNTYSYNRGYEQAIIDLTRNLQLRKLES